MGWFFICPAFASSTNGTIDSIYKYTWGENIGWIDFGVISGNVHVTDSALTGYAWGDDGSWSQVADRVPLPEEMRAYAHRVTPMKILPGLSPALAAALGQPAGKSFHFVLNDIIVKDNRIPPRGYTLAAFEAILRALDPATDQP